jgi:hypothetical protein
MAARRQASKMASQLPRTGLQISNLRQNFQRKELDDYIDEHPDMLETVIFVCKSGMLDDVREDLRKEHWLPESNKYFHNVSRAFFGTALTQLHADITIASLQKLTDNDGEVIWKLLFLALGATKQSRVPTLHKLSFFRLIKERYSFLGSRLDSWNWRALAAGEQIDFEKVGVYSKILDKGEIVGFSHIGGEKVQLKRPYPDHMVLMRNWSEKEASLVDVKDEEDDVNLRKRFKTAVPEIPDWTKEEVSAAEKACDVEAVRLPSAGGEASSANAGSSGSKAQAAKKQKIGEKNDSDMPAAPVITPIKITRQPRGALS